jgi:hypothetical protein
MVGYFAVSYKGRCPTSGKIHLSKPAWMVGTVVARIGLRFRVCDCSSQIFACSLNVTPTCCLTTRLKYCAVSTWASAMISLALLSRSLRFKESDADYRPCRTQPRP